jgi:hypothetical protein
MTLTSNTKGRIHFHTPPVQKQHFDTPNSYCDSESISPNNPIHKSQKTAKPTTLFAAASGCVHDSLIPNNLVHSVLAARQTETLLIHENSLVLNIC